MHCVMTVAGSDSGGGAGVQADLKTFAALGVHGTVALTAVTAQNSHSSRAVEYLSPDLVHAQMKAVLEDFSISAIKTGMLGNAEIVTSVAETVKSAGIRNLVVDPAMVAKSGALLLHPDALVPLKQFLLPLTLVVTPNAPELSRLTGMEVESDQQLKLAAVRLHQETGVGYVLAKGGHLPGNEATDWLYDGAGFTAFRCPRLPTKHSHGTGCTYSAALTAYLARGFQVREAVGRAKLFLTRALDAAKALGAGWGPVNQMAAGRFEEGAGGKCF